MTAISACGRPPASGYNSLPRPPPLSAHLEGGGAHIITITLAAVGNGVRRRHPASAGQAVQQSLEQRARAVTNQRALASGRKQILHLLPEAIHHDARMLTGVHVAVVLDVADIEDIGQQ